VVKRLILVIMFLALLFGGIFGWKYYAGQQKSKAMSAPPPPAVISSTRVQLEVWQPALKAVGSLVASKGINVASTLPMKLLVS